MNNSPLAALHTLKQKSLPRVGLGCMGMSEFYGPNDEQNNLKILDKAVELGYRHFDTADMYGTGANERLLGTFIKNHKREDLYIASKFGVRRSSEGQPTGPYGGTERMLDGSARYVREACTKSLERLGVDYLDLYYIHRRDQSTPIEETIGAMAELVREGLIRGIGLSEFSTETYKQAQALHPIAAVQTEYSLLSREPEQGMLEACKANGTAFVAYSPMSRGLLTGALTHESVQQEGDARQFFPRFSGENMRRNLSLLEGLQTIARKKECSPAQVALAWVLHQGEHIHIIPGTRTEKYLIENWNSLSVRLTAEELASLRVLFPHDSATGERYPEAGTAGING